MPTRRQPGGARPGDRTRPPQGQGLATRGRRLVPRAEDRDVDLALPRPRRAVSLRRPRRQALLLVAAVAVLLAGGWVWLRDSSLVAVRDVTIVGLSGVEGADARDALRAAAQDMTTLHVRPDALRTAVEPYPVVASVTAAPDVPHGLTIHVRERVPVAAVASGGAAVAVAGDGTILRGARTDDLPVVNATTLPSGQRLTTPTPLRATALMAAAPAALRARVTRAYVGSRGLTAQLRDGPFAYFGDGARLAAKWLSLAAILTDAGAQGASYIDVRLPEKPVAGGLETPPPSSDGAAEPQP
jgi:cell division protein FtsQ